MGSIFISYRREDTQGEAGHLLGDLRRHFGEERVFLDVAAIPPGEDFRKVIEDAIGSCEALIVLIGKEWLSGTDSLDKRRLDDPTDLVRIETAVALRRNARVFPVLVQGARMPKKEELPDDLKALSGRNAHELSHNRWDYDVQKLITALETRAGRSNMRNAIVVATITLNISVPTTLFLARSLFKDTGQSSSGFDSPELRAPHLGFQATKSQLAEVACVARATETLADAKYTGIDSRGDVAWGLQSEYIGVVWCNTENALVIFLAGGRDSKQAWDRAEALKRSFKPRLS